MALTCVGEHRAQGSRYKVHNVLDTTHKDFDQHTASVWENAEMFDPKTEHMFRYLQVRWQCEEGKGRKTDGVCAFVLCCGTECYKVYKAPKLGERTRLQLVGGYAT